MRRETKQQKPDETHDGISQNCVTPHQIYPFGEHVILRYINQHLGPVDASTRVLGH